MRKVSSSENFPNGMHKKISRGKLVKKSQEIGLWSMSSEEDGSFHMGFGSSVQQGIREQISS